MNEQHAKNKSIPRTKTKNNRQYKNMIGALSSENLFSLEWFGFLPAPISIRDQMSELGYSSNPLLQDLCSVATIALVNSFAARNTSELVNRMHSILFF